jgi:ABC-type transporter MlaC component
VLAGVLTLAAAAGFGVAARAEAPRDDGTRAVEAFAGAVTELKEFNARVCDAEPPALFDVAELGRRALGRHAHDHGEAEIARLGGMVARRLLRWYAGMLHRGRARADADPIVGSQAVVGAWARIRAITPDGRRRTVVYHLRWTEDAAWRVYDIEVNGRSRVRTDYAEFDRIILDEGYRTLVRRLGAEVDRDEQARRAYVARPDGCRNAS